MDMVLISLSKEDAYYQDDTVLLREYEVYYISPRGNGFHTASCCNKQTGQKVTFFEAQFI